MIKDISIDWGGSSDPTGLLPFAHSGPVGQGCLRTVPDDFIVEEELGYELTGEGEHVYLSVEKKDRNTEEIARVLAKYAGVHQRDVGFAGLKDRRAIARQWFSIRLPEGQYRDWLAMGNESFKVLVWRRHRRKLRRGGLARNHFNIRVRNLQCSYDRLDELLKRITAAGVPNYFGSQRFGHNGANLSKAQAVFRKNRKFRGRFERGILLSAARSFIFNQILAGRVVKNSWNRAIPGDALMLDGSRSYFKADTVTAEIAERIEAGKIHPTGALWGTGEIDVSRAVLALETGIAKRSGLFCSGLEKYGVEMARRSLRLVPKAMDWAFPGENVLTVNFSLPSGGYATTVLREMLNF